MELKDGVPCSHSGCLQHQSHACEGCGRIMGLPICSFYDWSKLDGKNVMIHVGIDTASESDKSVETIFAIHEHKFHLISSRVIESKNLERQTTNNFSLSEKELNDEGIQTDTCCRSGVS